MLKKKISKLEIDGKFLKRMKIIHRKSALNHPVTSET